MNLYFLVEGRQTESRVYPAWLSHLLPLHRRIDAPDEASGNSYFLISGEGYPQMLAEGLPASVADIRAADNYDYLVICLDVDETTPAYREAEVKDYLDAVVEGLPDRTIPKVIAQNRCIESWFLGNRAVFPRNPHDRDLRGHIAFYDVSEQCPEAMGCRDGFPTHAGFHHDYLVRVLGERNLRYTKHFPGTVQERYYLEELIARSEATGHLRTFRTFVELCARVREHSPAYR